MTEKLFRVFESTAMGRTDLPTEVPRPDGCTCAKVQALSRAMFGDKVDDSKIFAWGCPVHDKAVNP